MTRRRKNESVRRYAVRSGRNWLLQALITVVGAIVVWWLIVNIFVPYLTREYTDIMMRNLPSPASSPAQTP